MQWGREYGKEEGTERTFEESGWVKTGDSSAYVKDGRHEIGNRRKGRKEQIEVRVHSEQRQPQSRNMLVLISSKGTRRDLEAAEMGAQETQSRISTPPTWSKSQRVRLMDLALPPLLAKGYSAYGSSYFFSHSFRLLYSTRLDHSYYCNCLSQMPSLALPPLQFLSHRKK